MGNFGHIHGPQRIWRALRLVALGGMTVVLICGSLVYLGNTFLYLTPPNPLKAQLLSRIMLLQRPLFVQNWHLFAPNPVRHNFVLAVRCSTEAGVTPWRDATEPLLARHHQNRNTPMGRLLRVQENAMRFLFGATADDWLVLLCRRIPGHSLCRGEDQATEHAREVGASVLARYASSACDGIAGRGRTTAVQFSVMIHRPPPWSQRHLPDSVGETRSYVFPWLPYERVGCASRARGPVPDRCPGIGVWPVGF